MGSAVYPSGSGITTKVNTDLESSDMTFVGTDTASSDPWQTDYSDIKAGIIGNPGALGGVTPATSLISNLIEIEDDGEDSGKLSLKSNSASSGTLTGATDKIEVDIPSGAVILGASLRVDVAVVDDAGDDTWSAAYSGGATQAICSGSAAAKNTKVNTMFDPNGATPIAASETDITLTPNGGNFTAGEITAVVYYLELASLDDAP